MLPMRAAPCCDRITGYTPQLTAVTTFIQHIHDKIRVLWFEPALSTKRRAHWYFKRDWEIDEANHVTFGARGVRVEALIFFCALIPCCNSIISS